MTVEELIEALQKLPQDDVVYYEGGDYADDSSSWPWQQVVWVNSLRFIRSNKIKWLTKEEAIVYKLQGYNVTSAEKYLEKN